MNQIPCVPMTNPYMVQQQTTYMPVPQQPKYNAVNIEISNPSVGAQGVGGQQQAAYAQPTMPLYNYPQAPVYNYPQTAQQPCYMPPQMSYPTPLPAPAPAVATVPQEAPKVPEVAPAVQQQNFNQPVVTPQQVPVEPTPVVVPQPQISEAPKAPQQTPTPAPAPAPAEAPKTTEAAKPEVVPSEPVAPQVDLNSFIAKLANPDFDAQVTGMEEIAKMVKESPEKATELVDTKVFDALTNIINFDSSKLEGPTAEQVAAREKIMSGKEVTEQEKTLANTISPQEKAERNKSYALFTSAIMQKLYADEVARLSNSTVPLTELPGAVTIVDQLKDNPNPMVRASAIEALSYLQNPEYKKDLTTVFTVAKGDKDPNVAGAAKAALDKLNQIQAQPEQAKSEQPKQEQVKTAA